MGNVIHVIYGIPSEMSSNTVMWSVGGTTKTCDVILCNVFNRVLCVISQLLKQTKVTQKKS